MTSADGYRTIIEQDVARVENQDKPVRVVVYHGGFGCDTGCCGHYVQLGSETKFTFDHPDTAPTPFWHFDEPQKLDEKTKAWVRQTVVAEFGEEHVADIDWDGIEITGYGNE